MRNFLIVSLFLMAWPTEAYYGRNSIEADLSFEAVIDMPMEKLPTLKQLNGNGKIHDTATSAVHDQVLYIDGVFHSQTFADKWGGPASCGSWYEDGTYKITFLGVEQNGEGRVKLSYRFESGIVVQKDRLRRSETAKMEVWIPYAPDLVYDLGVKWNKNQCTDKEDNVKENFYYYWDPFMESCPLRKQHPESIQYITTTVKRKPNTRVTYPEYDQLYKDKSEKPTLDIAIFLGYISHGVKAKKPFYRDDGFQALKFVSEQLKGVGFEETEFRPHFFTDDDGVEHLDEGANVSRKLQKTVKQNGREVQINISMLLSDTEIHAKDPTFREAVKVALNKADIFVYDGHSGDGDNLSPEQLGLHLPRVPKYQIFFINGCDSYMNYLKQFVVARGGLSLLDLVLSSTPTLTESSSNNVWTFIQPFINLKTLTYQSMLDTLEKSNAPNGTFLVGVVGDEKNKWKPKR